MNHYDRRKFLAGVAGAGIAGLTLPRVAFATTERDQRFVFVILRGALDGLAAVPPVGDPNYVKIRGTLAVPAVGEGAVLPLDGTFGLHPSLNFLHESFDRKELVVLHAVATSYRQRSHFDAQDVLESGHVRPQSSATGWLNRAMTELPAGRAEMGVALGAAVPLVMRGAAPVASWAPTRLPAVDDDLLQRIGDLYANEPTLSRRLADALSADQIAKESKGDRVEGEMSQRGGAYAQLKETVVAAGGFLRQADGPRVAVFDTTGWDTHANEGGPQGQLAVRLRALDGALQSLRVSLGETWDKTVVVVATEFGRTVAVNGTRGTDHGTGAAAFVLGGAVRGGRIITDWPGLTPEALFEGRDLRPTTDLRSVFKTVLRDHLQVPQRHIDREVFPEAHSVPFLADLVAG